MRAFFCYCYYVKGEGKDAVRGDINGIHQHYRTDVANPNRAKGNHPLNGRILKSSRTYPGTTVSDDPADPQYRAPELMNMDLGAISARSGAPNDGAGKGEVQGFPNAYSRSKQNSDAAGMFYQWGQKEPRTFATSSLKWGTEAQTGKYPVKIYNGKSELIYQEDGGRDNKGMTPTGGVIAQNRLANSMMETVKKPNVFYYPGGYNAVISLAGHSKELWNYYWTSYSRGTDGRFNPITTTWHNTYLDGYIVLRSKSIYDPCPYGYRTFTNGTYNNFQIDYALAWFSYNGGVQWRQTWFVQQGLKTYSFSYVGGYTWCSSSTNASLSSHYTMQFSDKINCLNRDNQGQLSGLTVRCIEDATVKADDSEASASY